MTNLPDASDTRLVAGTATPRRRSSRHREDSSEGLQPFLSHAAGQRVSARSTTVWCSITAPASCWSAKGRACWRDSPAGLWIPPEFYQVDVAFAGAVFALPVLSALWSAIPRSPRKVLYGVQRIQTPASEWPARSCELSSIAVAPEASGNGLGKALCGLPGAGAVDGCAMRLPDHRCGWQRRGQRVLSGRRISAYAAIPATQRALDERIRDSSPTGRQTTVRNATY